jgi:predicted RNA binding protein YcfA (HicA-like mRNA interferase family)
MPKLPIISCIEAIKAFTKVGWHPHRQVGNHVVLRKEGSKVT